MPPRTPLQAISSNVHRENEITPIQRAEISGSRKAGPSMRDISQIYEIPLTTIWDTLSKMTIRKK